MWARGSKPRRAEPAAAIAPCASTRSPPPRPARCSQRIWRRSASSRRCARQPARPRSTRWPKRCARAQKATPARRSPGACASWRWRRDAVRLAKLVATAACGLGCSMNSTDRAPASEAELDAARNQMVREQIEARGGGNPRVLDAMRRVPRHELVPEDERELAYEDRPLPIGSGQTISQPYVVAAMTEALALTGSERVLEIGTGSGYQAAVLALVSRQVYTIEIVPELAARARADLARLG